MINKAAKQHSTSAHYLPAFVPDEGGGGHFLYILYDRFTQTTNYALARLFLL